MKKESDLNNNSIEKEENSKVIYFFAGIAFAVIILMISSIGIAIKARDRITKVEKNLEYISEKIEAQGTWKYEKQE